MILLNGNVIIVPMIVCYMTIRGILVGMKYQKLAQVQWQREMIHLLFVVYIGCVISVTLFPFPIGFPHESHLLFRSINLVPLVSIMGDISQIGTAYDGDVLFMVSLIARNVGGNILLFMPFGFLAPFLWDKTKSLKGIVLWGFVVSVTIECLQLLESLKGGWGRVTDIDDVICNGIGAMLGYFVYVLTRKIEVNYQIRRMNNRGA
ncbi:VanZ family protein [Rossellomorea sp. NPDC077527]|uniref:VanZ family protein n=1 Tax=Rossellomorea sp. NPDC077527 TaxID=3364510 RepID=UPI0037C81CBF